MNRSLLLCAAFPLLLRSARPGHSEHQLGTVIDVTSPGRAGRFGDWGAEERYVGE